MKKLISTVGGFVLLCYVPVAMYVWRTTPLREINRQKPSDARAVERETAYLAKTSASREQFEAQRVIIEDAISALGHSSVTSADLVAALQTLDESFMPTSDGLLARTTEMWEQPEFLAKLRTVVPLPADFDCVAAVQDPDAYRLLCDWVLFDMLASDYAEIPEHDESGLWILRRARDQAEDLLMLRLDQVTSYPHWSQLSAIYRKWSRE